VLRRVETSFKDWIDHDEAEHRGHLAKDAEAERSKLQTELDQAKAEIERLKSGLGQENASPSEESDPIWQPPGQW
jgi:hypothetical protein